MKNHMETIKALAEILNQQGLSCIEIKEGEVSYCVKREQNLAFTPSPLPAVISAEKPPVLEVLEEKGEKITSPLAGVFYAAPSPDSAPFVKVGDKVKKGDVLCIVEAMKLMNEINAERDCVITEVCVKNEEIVEYGQPLFKVE